jgi:hypothetical protein
MRVLPASLLLTSLAPVVSAASGGVRGDEGATKRPPCFSQWNPDFESLCFDNVAVGRGTNVSVRAYAAAGATLTTLAANQPGIANYFEALEGGIPLVITYFSPGFNAQLKPVNRTVPIMATHSGSPSDPFTEQWTVSMALPASVYPTSATAPQPDDPFFLTFATPFAGNNLVAVRHFVTPALPLDADWLEQSTYLAAHIPAGFSAVQGAPFTFAIYDTRDATGPRNNEVWLPVLTS